MFFRCELSNEKDKEKDREREQKKEKEEEKEKVFAKSAGTINNTESTKHLGRQKHVEQITFTAISPVSPCQVITVTNSDQSSSPALSSSISSQVISTENGQQQLISTDPQPLMITPTVERLLPIGTVIRATGKRFIILLYIILIKYINYINYILIK